MTDLIVDVPALLRRPGAEPHDALTRSLHWSTASLVVLLYDLYLAWEQALKGDFRHLLIVSHLSLGALLTAVLAGRLVWRSSGPSSRLDHEAGLRGLIARAVHLALYGLLIAQVLLGWNFRWAQGQPMNVFGLSVPSPFGYPNGARHTIAVLHYWVGTGIVALAAMHAAAALFHHFVSRAAAAQVDSARVARRVAL